MQLASDPYFDRGGGAGGGAAVFAVRPRSDVDLGAPRCDFRAGGDYFSGRLVTIAPVIGLVFLFHPILFVFVLFRNLFFSHKLLIAGSRAAPLSEHFSSS